MCVLRSCVSQQIADAPLVIRHKLPSELWPFHTPFGWRGCPHDYRLTGTRSGCDTEQPSEMPSPHFGVDAQHVALRCLLTAPLNVEYRFPPNSCERCGRRPALPTISPLPESHI